MRSEIIVAIVSLLGTLFGTFGGIITANKLSNYRIGQLEKKVDKHNTVIERMYKAEQDITTISVRVENLKEEIDIIREENKEK